MKRHEPNTPRTHNAKGQKVNEPVQCQACLQLWPCEVENLNRMLKVTVAGGAV